MKQNLVFLCHSKVLNTIYAKNIKILTLFFREKSIKRYSSQEKNNYQGHKSLTWEKIQWFIYIMRPVSAVILYSVYALNQIIDIAIFINKLHHIQINLTQAFILQAIKQMADKRKNLQVNNEHHGLNNSTFKDSIRSCEFETYDKKSRQPINKNILNAFQSKTNKQQAANYLSLKSHKIENNKILFAPSWKTGSLERSRNKQKVVGSNQSENVVDECMKKNEEIAKFLLKEKKSMSDYVYNTDKTKKINRYLQMKSTPQQPNKKTKFSNLPKLGKLVFIGEQDINQLPDNDVTSQEIEESAEPEYSKVTNIRIQKFLKLQQQAYNLKSIEEEHIKVKKKIHSNKKKQARRKKQRVKNSLEDFLETKIIRKENEHESLRTSSISKNQRIISLMEKMRDKRPIETPLVPIKTCEKKGQKNLSPVKKGKIGVNAKISQKNMLAADSEITVYESKIRKYREFLFIINLAHNSFDQIFLDDSNLKNQTKYKYYIGSGNNKRLIKALMRRRFWWVEVDSPLQANFVWTQLKVNSYYELQKSNERAALYESDALKGGVKKAPKNLIEAANSPLKKNYQYRAPFPQNKNEKVLTSMQKELYQSFQAQIGSSNNPQKFSNFMLRLKYFPKLSRADQVDKTNLRVHNHLQNNFFIGNKKALFYNLKTYYDLIGKNVFEVVPLTFHIGEEGTADPTYKQFIKYYRNCKLNKKQLKNIWIVKPGQNSNRGNGITVCSELHQINSQIRQKDNKGGTFIIQKYIQTPLLYKGRKFDIRHFMIATKIHGKMRLYWFGEGYIRTSSRQFDLEEIQDVQIHLTNDAIQQCSTQYGKFEQGNKISYTELQKYIDAMHPNKKFSITNDLYPRMKQISIDAFKSAYLHMDPQNLQHNFEIFGLDFMIDADFNVWLIQVNTNPCLEVSSNLLSRIIPTMVEHGLRLSIDPLFPPPKHYANTLKHYVPDNPLDRLQFELIFDEGRDGKEIEDLFKNVEENKDLQNLDEDQDTFDDEGKEGDFDIQ